MHITVRLSLYQVTYSQITNFRSYYQVFCEDFFFLKRRNVNLVFKKCALLFQKLYSFRNARMHSDPFATIGTVHAV